MYLVPTRRGMGIVRAVADGGAQSQMLPYAGRGWPGPVRVGPITVNEPTVPVLPISSPLGPGDVNPTPPLLPPPQPVGPVYAGTFTVGTPVPSNFPKNQIFVNTDGSFWQWSPSQSTWVSVGTPYSTGATPAQAGTGAPAGSSVYTTPVPAGYPTNQPYYDASGNIWTYNANTGQWSVTGTTATGGALIPTVAPAPSAASAAPVVTDGYQAILTWLNGTDLGSTVGVAGIPNWTVALGAALLLYKVAGEKGKR